MSSSSTPEPTPRLDLEDIEEDEREVEHEHERALGTAQAARKEHGGGWVTFLWALPGFVWLSFYLLAPLVLIVLVSFWTRTETGFVKDWTLSNYGSLLHPFNLSNAYWENMLRSFETSVIAVVACLVFGFPVAYFLAHEGREAPEPDRALHPRARALLDELPHPFGRVVLSADGP